jgi:hypothetical protein
MEGCSGSMAVVSDDRADRLSAFRNIVSRLRAGETVLVFPAGGLELDPALSRDAALASLGTWSRRIGVLARLAEDTLVVTAAVSGVLSRAAFDHPLARRRDVFEGTSAHGNTAAVRRPCLLPAESSEHRFGVPIAGGTRDLNAAVIGTMRALIGRDGTQLCT